MNDEPRQLAAAPSNARARAHHIAPWHPAVDPTPTQPAVLLLRHAERTPIHEAAEIWRARLTPRGVEQAHAMGRRLYAHGVRRLCLGWSPVERCAETARAIAEGLQAVGGTVVVLGPAGVWAAPYVIDPDAVFPQLFELGNAAFLRSWFDGGLGSGMAPAAGACQDLLRRLVAVLEAPVDAELRLIISHDWNVALLREAWIGGRVEEATLPALLQGPTLWSHRGRLLVAERGHGLRWSEPLRTGGA